MKLCKKCNKLLNLSEFSKNESYADGYMNICSPCNVESVRIIRRLKREGSYIKADRAAAAKKGNESVNKEQFKQRMSVAKSQAIFRTNLSTGEKVRFSSSKEAAAEGFNKSNISTAIKNNKPYRGFMWEKE